MSAVIPFKVSIPEAALTRLSDKLDAASYTDEAAFTDSWDYGAPLSDIKRLVSRWRNGFDWRAEEAKLNKTPQFTTKVSINGFGELNIHLIHQKSSRKDAIPLLFVHGWPGSFYEVLKILPLLTEPADVESPAFHVVAPSLPNFGFSDGVGQRGFSLPQYAETMHRVMINLGYDKYVTQGGDLGFFVTRCMASLFPEHALAGHVNFLRVAQRPNPDTLHLSPLHAKEIEKELTDEEKQGLERSAWFDANGKGYLVVQSTRPSTIGFALADSPVALLAWIYEKLHDWSDGFPWQDDEVLTWVSIYAFSTAGPAASVRIYYEMRHAELPAVAAALGYVPGPLLGASVFPKDVAVPPVSWAHALGPLVFARRHRRGGHFAAHECPEELVADLRDMFGGNGGAADVTRVFALEN